MARVLGAESLHDADRSTLPPEGSVLAGGFELIELVGLGGMGAVYRARDVASGRIVALKLLAVEGGNCLRRFRREFRAASRLSHPNVVPVHAFHDAPRPFFTMEFVPGATLERWVGAADGPALNRPRRVARIHSVLRQLLEAARYIHSHDLVHRDLKPENVLVTGDGVVKVMDFGVVRTDSPSGGITQGRIVGTLTYMAPEQLEGRVVDGRADLYSIGAILYELLTGEPPFGEGQFGSLARAVLDEMPPSPRSLNPGVDPVLAAFAMTLLAKKPWQRFSGAAQALTVLEARSADDAPGPHRVVLFAPGFAGRDAELTLVREALGLLVEERGGFLLAAGGAGSGRTRWLEEASVLARGRGLRVLGVDPAGADGSPFSSLASLFAALAGEMGDLPGVDRAALVHLSPAFGPGPGVIDEGRRAAGARAFARALLALSCDRGLVLLLDDLQEFDAASVDLLGLVAREILAPSLVDDPEPHLLVVGSYAEGEAKQPSPLGRLVDLVARFRLGTSFELKPLAVEETEALLRSMLGETGVPPALARHVHRETEGNPRYVVETIRHLVEEEYLVRDAGCLTLAWERLGRPAREELTEADFAGLPLARGVSELVERQLARLEPADRDLLATAAVAGLEFAFDTLLGASRLDEDRLIDALEAWLRSRLVVETQERRDGFRFAHRQAREVVLAGLAPEERRRRHAAVARALDSGPESERDAVALARHYDAAGMVEPARSYLPVAAERLSAMMRRAEAVEAWARFLELGGGDGPAAIRARRRLAHELGLVGRLGEARAVLEALLADAPDLAWRSDVLEALARVEWRRGEFGAAVARSCELLALARAHGDAAAVGRAQLVLGQAELRHHHLEEAERTLEEAGRGLTAAGDERGAAAALAARGGAVREQGRFVEAAELVQAALVQFRRHGDRCEEQRAVLELGQIHLCRGRLERGLACLYEAQAIAEADGHPERVAEVHDNLGHALVLAGDHGEAERCLARCLRHTADGRDPALAASAGLNRAMMRRFAGDLNGALGDVERAHRALEGRVHTGLLVRLHLESCRIEAALGRFAGARRSAHEALTIARANRLVWPEAQARAELAEVLRGEGALVQAERARWLAAQMGADLLLAQVTARLARLHDERGDRPAAQQEREAAARILRGIARSLGARERLFLRTPLSRSVIGALRTAIDSPGLARPLATTRA